MPLCLMRVLDYKRIMHTPLYMTTAATGTAVCTVTSACATGTELPSK
jgi:hypothetical protein